MGNLSTKVRGLHITTSGAARPTDRRSPSRSNTSPTTASAPSPRSHSASEGRRARPVTECPRPTSSGTTRRPITPVAPARKIRITGPSPSPRPRCPPVPPLLEFLVHAHEHLLLFRVVQEASPPARGDQIG